MLAKHWLGPASQTQPCSSTTWVDSDSPKRFEGVQSFPEAQESRKDASADSRSGPVCPEEPVRWWLCLSSKACLTP